MQQNHSTSRGGTTSLENLAYACSGCNGHKHNKAVALDPLDNTEVPLYYPRKQQWADHFGWDVSYRMAGISEGIVKQLLEKAPEISSKTDIKRMREGQFLEPILRIHQVPR